MDANGWRGAALLLWLAAGLWRLFVGLSLVLAVEPPAIAVIAIAGEAATAFGAAAAIARGRAGLAVPLFTAFLAFVVLQMGADALVYGIRSLLEALGGVLVALALVALGWLALRQEGSPARAL